jgi:hypothetical protein
MLLVAVPVFGMTVITTLVRTAHETPAALRESSAGANLAAIGNPATPAGGWPAGTQTAQGRQVADVGVVAPNGVARLANVTDFDLNNPVTKGAVLLRSGRFPTAGEALVSPRSPGIRRRHRRRAASRRAAWNERIVGIGVSAANWSDGLLAVRGSSSTHRFNRRSIKCSSSPSCACPGTRRPGALSGTPRITSRRQRHNRHVARNVNWTLVAG